jgi:hypothetical protein
VCACAVARVVRVCVCEELRLEELLSVFVVCGSVVLHDVGECGLGWLRRLGLLTIVVVVVVVVVVIVVVAAVSDRSDVAVCLCGVCAAAALEPLICRWFELPHDWRRVPPDKDNRIPHHDASINLIQHDPNTTQTQHQHHTKD